MNESLELLKNTLSALLETYSSFDDVNLFEHRKEMLCFLSLKESRVSDERFVSSGNVYRTAEDEFEIILLSAQRKTAKSIEEFADGELINSLISSDLKIKKLTREKSEFLKDHLRYSLKISLTVERSEKLAFESPIDFSIDGVTINRFLSFKVSLENDFFEKKTVMGNMICEAITQKPKKLILLSKLKSEEALQAFEELSSYSFGTRELAIGSVRYYLMMMSHLEAKPDGKGFEDILCEFTEVSA